jgi:hypothetical protein
MECGHSSVCHKCYQPKCHICHHVNQYIKKFNYNEKGYLECFDLDDNSMISWWNYEIANFYWKNGLY